ncbi:unnamed protein product [Caenorhabditis auriculariae]|uniref:Ankyrin repeat protein n=1 Tax=Caenorhabditis auriculariae TaxID=2777116 RepID=A0A8S1H2B5_9PELO|nr:unnamed protein product [Caenorhabditis auriculariae]
MRGPPGRNMPALAIRPLLSTDAARCILLFCTLVRNWGLHRAILVTFWCKGKKKIGKSFFHDRDRISAAIYKRDFKKIKKITERLSKEDLEQLLNEPFYKIPLVYACETGSFDIVKLLIRLGANPLVYYQFLKHKTALRVAIEKIGSTDISDLFNRKTRHRFMVLQVLLKIGKVPLTMPVGFKAEPPLFTALRFANFGLVKYLCDQGACVQDRDENGKTLFMKPDFFKSKDSTDIFEYLLAQGLSIDAVDRGGLTALHFAVIEKDLHLVKLLTRAGANLIPDPRVLHPIFVAALQRTNSEVFEHLVEFVKERRWKKDGLLLRATTELLKRHKELSLELVECLRKPLEMTTEEEMEDYEYRYYEYDELCEATSISEFEEADDLERFTVMQCFIMRERILGRDHPEVRNALFSFIPRFPLGYDPRNSDLLLHIAFLFLSNLGLSGHSLCALQCITFHALRYLREHGNEEAYDQCMYFGEDLLEEVYLALKSELILRTRSHELKQVGEILMTLFTMIGGIPRSNEDQTERGFSIPSLRPILRIAAIHQIPLFHSGTFFRNPNWISIFVQAGANINEKDSDGRTALAASFQYFLGSAKEINEKFRHEKFPIVREFVTNGSRLFQRDAEGNRIFASLVKAQGWPNFEDPMVLGKFITLKDMSAEIVEATYPAHFLRKNLPLDLSEYLSLVNIYKQ